MRFSGEGVSILKFKQDSLRRRTVDSRRRRRPSCLKIYVTERIEGDRGRKSRPKFAFISLL